MLLKTELFSFQHVLTSNNTIDIDYALVEFIYSRSFHSRKYLSSLCQQH